MKTRFLNNYITTLIGLMILVFCGVMMYMEKATVQDMSGWLATGLLFLRSKDSLIALPPKE
jgi:hypothetical protein